MNRKETALKTNLVSQGHGSKRAGWTLLALGVIALCIGVFGQLLTPGSVLLSTDDNIGLIAGTQRNLPQVFLGYWNDDSLIGMPVGMIPVIWTSVLCWLLPLRMYVNLVHALALVLASLLLGGFLRSRRVGWGGACLGAATAFWLGSNLTLVFAGHTPKFAVLMFAALTLFSLSRASRPSLLWSLIAGGGIGLMLSEQQDLALFFGLFLAPYALFLFLRQSGWSSWPRIVGHFAAMGAVIAVICLPAVLRTYLVDVRAGGGGAEQADSQAKWEFCTQWSVPVDETIDLIAPNYFGVRSGEPVGPYWGRTGQSAGWEQTRQGFMNFRLESIYIGAIPVALALFAIVAALLGGGGFGVQCSGAPPDQRQDGTEGATSVAACLRQVVVPVTNQSPQLAHDRHATARSAAATGKIRPEPRTLNPEPSWSDRRAEILFWGCAALIALLLAYGKYFPLYALFYQLPVVNNIRNPNKFIQVFQLCLGILAAYGLDEMLKSRKGKEV